MFEENQLLNQNQVCSQGPRLPNYIHHVSNMFRVIYPIIKGFIRKNKNTKVY